MSDTKDLAYYSINQIAMRLGLQIDRTRIEFPDEVPIDSIDSFVGTLQAGAQQVGIRFVEVEITKISQLIDYVSEGMPILLVSKPNLVRVVTRFEFGKFEVVDFDPETRVFRVRSKAITRYLKENTGTRFLVGQDELECRAMSTVGALANLHGHSYRHGESHGGKSHGGEDHGGESHGAHHAHIGPVRRFLAMLKLDRRDILTTTLFALVASILALATPLAVESLVNVVSWGVYLQPLLVLSLMLLICLGLAAVLKVLQTVLVEIIQRRQFVRIVGDLSHRFPRANRSSLSTEYPRELANRIFDVMTIQKATAVLLFDGISIILTTVLGLVLLAVYHPLLLGFDLVLLLLMTIVTWVLGRGGIRTAIDESITKYRIAHWLQDVIDSPTAFRLHGGEAFAIDRANFLTVEYIAARKRQFRVIIRQVIFAVGLQVVASTALLGLGGWLVIEGELTLGQLVASELVVTVVVGAFAKAGKSLEKFYDLMAGIDKVGHLIDVHTDPRPGVKEHIERAEVQWDALKIQSGVTRVRVPAGQTPSGGRVAILDDGSGGRALLAQALAGLISPADGTIRIGGAEVTPAHWDTNWIGFAGRPEVFCGTLRENISLGRVDIGRGRIREVLQQVGLWETVCEMNNGMDCMMQTGGFPLNSVQVNQLMLARALVGRPKILVVDQILDTFSDELLDNIWKVLANEMTDSTIFIVTNLSSVSGRCQQTIQVETVA